MLECTSESSQGMPKRMPDKNSYRCQVEYRIKCWSMRELKRQKLLRCMEWFGLCMVVHYFLRNPLYPSHILLRCAPLVIIWFIRTIHFIYNFISIMNRSHCSYSDQLSYHQSAIQWNPRDKVTIFLYGLCCLRNTHMLQVWYIYLHLGDF